MEERKTGYLLKLVVERLRADADAGLKQHNLTWVQSRLIGFLAYRGGQATQKELERSWNAFWRCPIPRWWAS